MKKALKVFLIAAALFMGTACGKKAVDLKIGQALSAPHGTKAFGTATVVLEGDKILLAYIDEYQFLASATFTGVPNSDTFTEAGSIAEGYVLGSKRVNADAYSANMEANGGATVSLDDNYDAIQAYVVGKTVAELETLVAGTSEEVIDAVAGATLADTPNYLQMIIDAAKAADQTVSYEGDTSKLVLNQINGAPHGTRSFSVISVLTDGTDVVLAYIDEFQFLASATFTGVPNSDEFTAGGSVAEGYVLGSKRVNTEPYSANMEANGGATIAIDANYDAIQTYVAGKSIADLETLSAKTYEEVIDVVAGATLTDAPNYLAEIVQAAKASK